MPCRRHRTLFLLPPSFCLLLVSLGCGKKGPPLAPFVRIPEAVGAITARRAGSDVFVTLTVPKQNLDATVPVAISRVDVYGYTGRTPPLRSRWVELGTLVASIPIAPGPGDLTDTAEGKPSVPPAAADPNAARPGSTVTVHDTLSADELVQGPEIAMPVPPRGAGTLPLPVASALPLRRYYMAFGYSPRERPSAPGAMAELPLTPVPDPPTGLQATYTDAILTLTWEPAGGLLGFLMDRPLGPEEPPFGDFDGQPEAGSRIDALPPGPTTYNVYRELEPDPLAPLPATAESTWNRPPPAPLNPAPLATLAAADTALLGRHRCYVVRAARGSGTRLIESAPSEAYCLTPVDVFPPAPPRSLAAIPAGGTISLIWEPNDEPDLGGYLVLRGEGPDGTLQALTTAVVTEPRYRDATVKSGVRYVYAVVAVDTRLPVANISEESPRVEETAP